VKDDEIFMSWLGSITGEYPDSIKLNEFTAGKEVPFTIPAAMIKGNEGGTVEVKYEIKRAAGGTSYSDTLKFSVGVALDLKAPKIKEAPNDTSLDPLNAQNTLTAVIDYDGMLVGDKISVRWTGAPGTLPAGSHTTDPWPVTRVGPQEIPLDVSVIAFNLDKSITLDYAMTRGTQEPKDSQTRTLAVLQLRVDLSHSPKIIQAAAGGNGTELDVSTLTAAATLRGGFWPHIASGQRVWMEVQGTKKDDTEYKRVVWRGPSNAVNGTWISQGYLDASLPLADLQSLKDLSPLNVSFMATPDRSTDENLALSFPVRTYTVKNVVEVLPTIESIKESPGGEEIPHGSPTVKTAVTLSGKATPGKKIDLANNGAVMPNTEIQVDSKGEWTFQLTGLVVGNTYKLSAQRKDGTPSNTRNVVVVALVVPTLDNVLDDKGIEVPDRQFTVSTQLKLKGTASYGQKVEIFEGNGPSHTSKGVATASTTTGIWELSITVAVGARRLYAGSLYTPSLQWSNVRTLTVTEATVPTLTSVKGSPSGVEIPNAKFTVETAVTLSGVAAKGQQIEVFDGSNPKGKATADPATGIWVLPVTGLSVAAHSFKAKALYGAGAESAARTLTVTAATAPTLTSVKGSPSGVEIPNAKFTVETAVTLSGVAAKGQQIEVFDGSNPKGKATADPATGKWELPVSGLSAAAHSFKAKALYAPGAESTPPRTLTVVSFIPFEGFESLQDQEIFTTLITPVGTFTKNSPGFAYIRTYKPNPSEPAYPSHTVHGRYLTIRESAVNFQINFVCSSVSFWHSRVDQGQQPRVSIYDDSDRLLDRRLLSASHIDVHEHKFTGARINKIIFEASMDGYYIDSFTFTR
ncbi:hypothetical protein M9827_04520, partial [Pseudomonas sp. AKS31]|nr:hypothetical protein [Pseudomonas sp. AKS31]